MADKMFLVITIRKEVTDKASAKAMVAIIESNLANYPDVSVTSHITDHFDVKGTKS